MVLLIVLTFSRPDPYRAQDVAMLKPGWRIGWLRFVPETGLGFGGFGSDGASGGACPLLVRFLSHPLKTDVNVDRPRVRNAPGTFNFLRHVMRAILSVRPKCCHRCVSLKETTLKPVQNPQACNQKLNRANRYENEMV